MTELLLAGLMRGHVELPLHLGSRQPQRLELPCPLGVTALGGLPRLALFLLALFHSLGEAGFRVDQSFSGITHAFDYTDLQENSLVLGHVGNTLPDGTSGSCGHALG